MTRFILHMLAHLLVPGLVAKLAFASQWQRAWGIMVATMLVDLDHLLSTPVFDPNRCSIGHHILHSEPAMAVYGIMLLIPQLRIVATGLLIHMALDALDCYFQLLFPNY